MIHPKRGEAAGALRSAALEAFVTRGYHAVGVREIAKVAGVSEAALYRHWPGKEALALDLFTGHVAEVNALLDAALAGPLDQGIPAAAAAVCRLYDERPLVFRFVLLIQHDLAAALPVGTRMPMDAIIERLGEARARGETTGDPVLLSAALVGVFLQTATYVLYGRLPGPLARHQEAIARSALTLVRQAP